MASQGMFSSWSLAGKMWFCWPPSIGFGLKLLVLKLVETISIGRKVKDIIDIRCGHRELSYEARHHHVATLQVGLPILSLIHI